MECKFIYKSVTALMLTLCINQTIKADEYDLDDRIQPQHSAINAGSRKKPIITKEEQWWNDCQSSKSKNIVQYVHDLSKSNPEAAAWFLLTGGKNGFANRQATAEEENLLLDAIDNIAPTFTKIDNKNEWMTPLRSENPIGKNHYEIILKKAQEIGVASIKSVLAPGISFADQLQEMMEKAEKERQEIRAKVDREREERDRQCEKERQREDFRDYHKGLMETLENKLEYTKEGLDQLLKYETSENYKILCAVVDCFKKTAEIRKVDHFIFKSKKSSNDELSKDRSAYYDKKRQITSHWGDEGRRLTSEWGDEGRRLTSEWHKISSNPTASKKQKDDAYQHLKVSEKKIWEHLKKAKEKIWEDLKKAGKEADESYSKLEQKLKDKQDEARQAEISKVLAQYGSVRKANQERLKAKYAEWQAKRSTLEALGIETSSEIIQNVNNAFAGLLTTADMRDGLIETLEKRAERLEHEERGQEILKKWKTKELQVKGRLYNKNFRLGVSNQRINEFVTLSFKAGKTPKETEISLKSELGMID